VNLRVGLVGVSGHTSLVLDGLRETPGAVLVSVAPGSSEENTAAFYSSLGKAGLFPKVYDDYRRMLDAERLDVVVVTPPFYLHAAVSIEALQRGCAVYSEKPAALTHAELRNVRDAWRASGKPLGMMLDSRYDPYLNTAHQLVRDGVIGDPVLVYGQKTYQFGQRPDFYRQRETSGGLIPWVGIHAIDWCRWVSGRQYTAFTASHGKVATPGYPGMEDHAACLFELDNGGSAVMSFDFLRPPSASSHGDDYLRMTGSCGYIEVRLSQGLQVFSSEGPIMVPLSHPAYGPFADFLHSVMDPQHVCLVSAADTMVISELALCARDAADHGKRILLKDVSFP
jgi:predicted dehydrogenase